MEENKQVQRSSSQKTVTILLTLIAAAVLLAAGPAEAYFLYYHSTEYWYLSFAMLSVDAIFIYFVVEDNWKAALLFNVMALLGEFLTNQLIEPFTTLHNILATLASVPLIAVQIGITLFAGKKIKTGMVKPLLLVLVWMLPEVILCFYYSTPDGYSYLARMLLKETGCIIVVLYGLLYFLNRELMGLKPAAKPAGKPDWKAGFAQNPTAAVQNPTAAVQKPTAAVQNTPKQYAAPTPSAKQSGEKICPQCKRHYGSQECFCQVCGIPLKRVCPHCGTEAGEDDLFCQHCGKSL